MPTEEREAANATESSNELSLTEYRALREGREAPKPLPAEKKPDAPPDAIPTGETAGDSETPGDPEGTQKPDSEEKANRKKERLNTRFSELTETIRGLETQLAEARSSRGAGQPETQPAKPAAPAAAIDPSDLEPKPDDFTEYIEWQKQWNRWDRRQDARQQFAENTRRQAADEQRSRTDAWQARVVEAQSKHDDFAEVAQNPNLPVTPTMAQAITDSETGTEILYHLGQNPAEAARIAKLSPIAQVRAIGVLEAKLAPESKTEEPPDPKPVSQAPKPIKPLAGSAAAASGSRNLEGMTQAEYRALRESGKLR